MKVSQVNMRPVTRKQRQDAQRRHRQRQAAEKRRAAERAAAEAEEVRAEGIAPALQRQGVPGVCHPRLEPDGTTFRVASPLRYLVARSAASEAPLITAGHLAATTRLALAWETGGRSVGMGASRYGEWAGGAAQTGYIPDRLLAALKAQLDAKAECDAARVWLGGLWGVVLGVGLNGTDVSAWARAQKMDRKAAMGYLRAALDRLVEFYARRDGE